MVRTRLDRSPAEVINFVSGTLHELVDGWRYHVGILDVANGERLETSSWTHSSTGLLVSIPFCYDDGSFRLDIQTSNSEKFTNSDGEPSPRLHIDSSLGSLTMKGALACALAIQDIVVDESLCDWDAYFATAVRYGSEHWVSLAPLDILWERREPAMLLREDCPQEYVNSFATGDREMAASLAVRHPNCSREALNIGASNHLLAYVVALGNHPEWLSEETKHKATERWSHVRTTEAKQPGTTPERLRELAKDESLDVLIAVAENMRTPPDVLAELAMHANPWIRKSAVKNPNCPTRIRAAMNAVAHDTGTTT